MKFLSGTRARSISFTVEPARPVMDMATGRSSLTPAIRAKFVEHKFDSEIAEREERWQMLDRERQQPPGTIRKQVEEALINHPDFGRSDGRGIFLDKSATLSETELRAKGVRKRCIFMQETVDGNVMCGEYLDDPESDYCEPHEAIVQQAIQSAQADVEAQVKADAEQVAKEEYALTGGGAAPDDIEE